MPVDTKPITLSHAGIHTLASCLAELGPCTTPDKVVSSARLWAKVRQHYNRTVAGHSLDQQFARQPGETDDALSARLAAFNAACDVWADGEVTIHLTNKQLDLARTAVKWCIENRERAATKVQINGHTDRMMVAIGLADAESEDASPKAAEA